MSLELVCRGIFGVTAVVSAAIIKGMCFGGTPGAAVAGASAIATAAAAGETCRVISYDTYMRANCPKLIESHKSVLGGFPHAVGVLPQEAYVLEQECLPYLSGGAKFWGENVNSINNPQLPLPAPPTIAG
jgi:hypothetical protein